MTDAERLLYEFLKENKLTFMESFAPKPVDSEQIRKEAIRYGLASLISGIGAYIAGQMMGGPEVGKIAALEAAGQPLGAFTRILEEQRQRQEKYTDWWKQLMAETQAREQLAREQSALQYLIRRASAGAEEEITQKEKERAVNSLVNYYVTQGMKESEARKLAEAQVYAGYKPPQPSATAQLSMSKLMEQKFQDALERWNTTLLNAPDEKTSEQLAEQAYSQIQPLASLAGYEVNIVQVKTKDGKIRYNLTYGVGLRDTEGRPVSPPGGQYYAMKTKEEQMRKVLDLVKLPAGAVSLGKASLSWAEKTSGMAGILEKTPIPMLSAPAVAVGHLLGRVGLSLPVAVTEALGIKKVAPAGIAWLRMMGNMPGQSTAEQIAAVYHMYPKEARMVDKRFLEIVAENPYDVARRLRESARIAMMNAKKDQTTNWSMYAALMNALADYYEEVEKGGRTP